MTPSSSACGDRKWSATASGLVMLHAVPVISSRRIGEAVTAGAADVTSMAKRTDSRSDGAVALWLDLPENTGGPLLYRRFCFPGRPPSAVVSLCRDTRGIMSIRNLCEIRYVWSQVRLTNICLSRYASERAETAGYTKGEAQPAG